MRRVRIVLAAALLGVLALAALEQTRSQANRTALAQSTLATYAIDWFTIDGGGLMYSASGEYALGGTIGQPDAGSMSSGQYALNGGFWAGSQALYTIALPIVAK